MAKRGSSYSSNERNAKKHHKRQNAESDTTSTMEPKTSPVVACSSSAASKVPRDLCNWAFLRSFAQIKCDLERTKTMVEKEGYKLKDMAKAYDIQIPETDSDNAATQLVTNLVKRYKLNFRVKIHPSFIYNEISVDKLEQFYDTEQNKADVGVMKEDNKSMVVCIEVNSSPHAMKETVIKTIHGVVQLLRIVKAHDIPDKEVSLVGFALPKLDKNGVAVKVKVQYKSDCMGFDVSSEPLSCDEFHAELEIAITSNNDLLCNCQKHNLKHGYKQHVISLHKDEMSCFGDNPKQHPGKHGVLFEVKKNEKIFYYKKPTLSVYYHAMKELSDENNSYAIKYEEFNEIKKIVGYRKVKYDPLSYEEAKKCLKELLREVFNACKALSDCNTTHGDVRLPNICFNEEYKLVLIDFDQSEKGENLKTDLSIFVEDLKKHARIQTDEFLSAFVKGEWCEDLLEKSEILKISKKSIKAVISERSV